MGELRVITNEQFEEALNGSYVKKIINVFIKKYGKDYYGILLEALWSALKSHDYASKRRFETSFYTYCKWRCNTEYNRRKKKKNVTFVSLDTLDEDGEFLYKQIEDKKDFFNEKYIFTQELISKHLSKKSCAYINDFYFCKYSIKEIAKRHRTSAQKVRKSIKQSIAHIKEVYESYGCIYN